MNIHKDSIISVFRILMVLITTYAILIQPVLGAGGNEKVVVYDLTDLEEEPNSNEGNNEEEVLNDTKIDSQFIGNNLDDFNEKNKNSCFYKEPINFDSILEIHIPPPDFL